MRLLMVEDEKSIVDLAKSALKHGGYEVDSVDCLEEASSALAIYPYDMILLDRNLPDGDGLSFLKTIRRDRNETPVIMVSAVRKTIHDRIAGLDHGADDYLCKPLDTTELMARVRCVLRRPRALSAETIEIGNIRFEIASRQVEIGGTPVSISRRELGILENLMRAWGRTVPRDQIEQANYGFDDAVSLNAIEVSVHRLRRKLAQSGASIEIKTIRGLGYMLRDRVTDG
ncbi:MAG: response regulator transcription factor [Pseudomonadota bacterium]